MLTLMGGDDEMVGILTRSLQHLYRDDRYTVTLCVVSLDLSTVGFGAGAGIVAGATISLNWDPGPDSNWTKTRMVDMEHCRTAEEKRSVARKIATTTLFLMNEAGLKLR